MSEVWPIVEELRAVLGEMRNLLLASESVVPMLHAGADKSRLQAALRAAWPAYNRFTSPDIDDATVGRAARKVMEKIGDATTGDIMRLAQKMHRGEDGG